MKRAALLVLVAIVLASCSTYYTNGDYFFVRNAGADMPVWVTGNLESETMVLFLHGGPGGNSSTASLFPAFSELEGSYTLAYWDQRASGLSQGNPGVETYTVDQFVEDMDLVVDVLLQLYSPGRLVIFGHSWGGALGVAYLTDPVRQAKVSGFLMHDAGYNLADGLPASGEWMRSFAQDQISAGRNVEYWTSLRDWLADGPDFTVEQNYRRLAASYSVQGESDAYYYDPANKGVAGPDGEFIFTSFASLALLTGGASIRENFNILELDLSSNLPSLTLPTLVMWGRHDGVNTVEMGEDAFALLGTAPTEKRLVVFEESGHQPFVEEPNLFVSEFVTFVEGL
jgi:pimeloyl-ACP methyl ester carboxylesterase